MLKYLLVIALASQAFGCGGGGGDKVSEDLSRAEDLVAGEGLNHQDLPGEDAAAVGAVNMTGVWAQYQEVSTLADVPMLGEVKTLSRAYVRLIVVQNQDSLELTQEVCALSLDSENEFARTIIPDAFVRSLKVVTKPGLLLDNGEGGLSFHQPPSVEVHGVELADPELDEMPVDPSDPRILDQDEDGNPGLTVFVTGLVDGEIYVIQRARSELFGEFQGPDKLSGLMTWEQEQVVLGSDNQILRDNPITTRVDPDPQTSFFISARVDQELGCEGIMEKKDELFGLDY